MSRKRATLVWAIAACAIVAGGLVLILGDWGEAEPDAETKGRAERPFEPRRSARDLERGLERLRRERSGLPAEIGAAGAEGEAKDFLETRAEIERQQTPDQAMEHAREKLAEIESQLAAAGTDEERDRLARRKQMVESVLAKLESMGQ